MTKLLISLPLSEAAQKYYCSIAPTYNKTGDAGIDLPFITDIKPYDAEVTETIGVISFDTVFAMYDVNCPDNHYRHLFEAISDNTNGSSDYLKNISKAPQFYRPCHFNIRPRSSIGKTPFRLANSVGTIDKTYCGIELFLDEEGEEIVNVKGDALGCYLDYHPQLGAKPRKAHIDAGDRLLQVIAPNLDNIVHVRLDFTEANCSFWSEVIGNKQRNGFGSTNV